MTGWDSKSLGDVCEVLDSRRRPVTKKDRRAGEYPYYGATGIVDYVDDFIFDEPLVLVGEDGAKWGSGEGTAFSVSGRCWVNNHAHVLRPIRTRLLDEWLVYYLVHEDLSPFVSGLTVPKLNQGNLREIPIPLPPVAEQRRILAILDEAFEGIATAKANAEKNLQNARELFENLLQATFNAEVVPWPVQRLGTLCIQVTDGTHNSPPYVETGVAMLDSKHIGDSFEIDDSRAEKFIAPDVDAQLAQRCKPGEGDILISSRGTIGKIAIVQAGQDFNIMGNMILLRLPPDVDRHFIAFYVLSRVAHIESIARGVAQKGLYLGQVRDYEVPVPPLDEQRRIAKRLRCLQMESARLCEVINRKLEALDDLRKSLLHQAFTGAL